MPSPSINLIKSSDGTGNAAMATVQSTRASGASTISVDTVDNIPATFYGSMGTPHTFVDPITAETITVISQATSRDFEGHVDGTNLEIDAMAPGNTDLGSAAGDVIIIKPTTPWANNIATTFAVAHNDDGSLKDGAVDASAVIVNDVVEQANLHEKLVDYSFDFVASGCVITGDSYGSNLLWSMTAGVVYIGGKRVAVSAITAASVTASKDTYVDVANTGTVTYTGGNSVANNAASPALAASSVRLGIIVSGANIASVGSVNQGQEFKVLPIASSIPYQVTDSLGNLICPRDPNRKLLGCRQITGNVTTTSATAVQITGLSVPCIIPTGRKVKLSLILPTPTTTGSNDTMISIWNGTVASGTLVTQSGNYTTPSKPIKHKAEVTSTQSAGLNTFNAGFFINGGSTFSTNAGATYPAELRVELE